MDHVRYAVVSGWVFGFGDSNEFRIQIDAIDAVISTEKPVMFAGSTRNVEQGLA